MKRSLVYGFITALVLAASAGFCEDPTTLAGLVTSAQTAVLANVWPVATGAFAVIAVTLGIGMLFKWIKKAAKSS